MLVAHQAGALCALLLAVMAANLLSVLPRKNLTNDELAHIPAGYYHLVEGFFQINSEHPPLVKMWAVLPLLFIQPDEPPPPAGQTDNSVKLTLDYVGRFWPDNRERFRVIAFWTRVAMIVLTLTLGLLIFIYARQLFGARAAVFAVALYAFEPTILAHGRIVQTDVPAALTYLLFFMALHRYLRAKTWRRALLLGLAGGAALGTKFSMIVLLPVLAGLALTGVILAPRLGATRVRLALHAGLVFLIILLVINAAYYFQRPPLAPADAAWIKSHAASIHEELMTGFRVGAKVVPTYFLFGLYNVMLHNQHGHPTSLLGQYSTMGWWYYFPVAFSLKTSLPFLLLSIASLGWALWKLLVKRDKLFLALLIPFAIYLALSMKSNINIGIRHLLPAFPFLFMLGGALLNQWLCRAHGRMLRLGLVVLTLGWSGFEAARAYPDYLPYMNQLAARHPRWYYLSDSNVEWGDDVQALAGYLHARGEHSVRGAMSGAWGTLNQYGITYHDMSAKSGEPLPETRYIAIGASFLNGSTNISKPDQHGQLMTEEQRVNLMAEYRTRPPEAVFGQTIYLYRVK